MEMAHPEIVNILNKYTRQLMQKLDVNLVILYGDGLISSAEDITIDVAVFVDKLEMDYIEAIDIMSKLAKRIDKRIEPDLIERQADDPLDFVDELLNRGEIIFKKSIS